MEGAGGGGDKGEGYVRAKGEKAPVEGGGRYDDGGIWIIAFFRMPGNLWREVTLYLFQGFCNMTDLISNWLFVDESIDVILLWNLDYLRSLEVWSRNRGFELSRQRGC